MVYEKFDDVDWVTPDAKEFAYYWRSLDRDNTVPRRSSFDPTRISSLLPFIAIYEVLSKDEFIYRLAGTAIVERFGMEVTGKNFLDFWEGDRRDRAASSMYECIQRPCGIFTELTGVSKSGQVETSVAVGFPLLDDRDVCNRLVFFSSGFKHGNTRVPREDQIEDFTAAKSHFIDINS